MAIKKNSRHCYNGCLKNRKMEISVLREKSLFYHHLARPLASTLDNVEALGHVDCHASTCADAVGLQELAGNRVDVESGVGVASYHCYGSLASINRGLVARHLLDAW